MEAGMIETVRRFDASQGPRKLGAEQGKAVDVAGLGVRFMVYGVDTAILGRAYARFCGETGGGTK